MSEEQEPHVIDRTGWPAGPWDGEPDKVNWKTKAGLPGMIVRGPMGTLCGYVAVTKGHPLYEKSARYTSGREEKLEDLEVHGGITYAAHCSGNICHVPEPGEPDDVWWLGFDCGHAWDVTPGMLRFREPRTFVENGLVRGETYKNIAYVRAEVEKLAEQLAEMA